MRRIKFWILAAISILTLVSIRDKEIILHAPTAAPLVAEAYQSPDKESSQTNISVPLASSRNGTALQNFTPLNNSTANNNTSDYDSPDTPQEKTVSTSPSLQANSSDTPEAPSKSNSSDDDSVVYGLSSVLDTTTTDDPGDGDSGTGSEGSSSSPAPVYVTGVTPNSAIPGVAVTIQGAGFSATAKDTVKFGDTESDTVTVVSANQICAAVPQGLPEGFTDITVSVDTVSGKMGMFDILGDTAGSVFVDQTTALLDSAISLSDSSIIRTGDVDGDKDLDLLVVDTVLKKVYLLVNDGSGRFTNGALPDEIKNSASIITDAALGDINGDGFPELFLTYSEGQAIKLFSNNGAGVFTYVSDGTPALAQDAAALDLGDVNGDGYLDIVVAVHGSQDLLLVNDCAGKFSQDTQFNLPAVIDGSSDIRFCDVDGDGRLDILTTNNEIVGSSDLRNRVYINNGSGGFTDATNALLPDDSEYSEVLDTGDVNSDGKIDLVVACFTQNLLLMNNGDGSFADKTADLMPANDFNSRDIKLGDLNGDGRLDAVVLGEDSISLYMNDKAGSFKNIDASIKLPDYRSTPALIGGQNVQLADINGDGALDIIVGGSALRILVSSAVNKPPVLDPIGNKTIGVGKELIFNINAADPNGDPLLYLAEGLPVGAAFDNKVFSWTPAESDEDTVKNLRFIAREDNSSALQDSEDITITVSGTPPVLTVTPSESSVTLHKNESTVFMASASDPDTPVTITWTVNGEVINGTPSEFSILSLIFGTGDYTIVVTATDCNGNSSSFTWAVEVVSDAANHAPVIDALTPAAAEVNINVKAGETKQQSFQVTQYHDPDSGQSVSFKWYKKPAGGLYTELTELQNAQSGLLALAEGEHYIKVVLTDNGTPAMSTQFEWHVTVTGNNAPVIDEITPAAADVNITIHPGEVKSCEFKVKQYHDPDSGQSVSFKWYKKPAGGSYTELAELQNAQSGALALPEGEYYIKVVLTDNGTPAVSTPFEWHVTVTESSTPAYTLTLTASNGSIAKSPDKTTYTAGEVVTLTAAPAGGYSFSNWSGDLTGSTNPATITMNANKSVTALFTVLPALTINATAGTGGDISPSGAVSVANGASQTFTVTADTGYNIDQVLVDGAPVTLSGGTYTFTNVTTNHTIAASFTEVPAYTLTLTASNGSIAKSPDKTTYTAGEVVTLTAAPAGGYSFSNWSGDLTGSTNPATITMNANKSVTALFTASLTIEEQILITSFKYFWHETDNPATGFVRDRLPVDPANRNATWDTHYNMASMAATGFGLAAMCVAAEHYGDGTNPDWQEADPDKLKARVTLIFDKLLEIQGNQNSADPSTFSTWGRDGLFYHYVNIETGERWAGSEVSTVDTAILVAGVLTAGEYFGGDLKDKALLIYKNINWKAFLDQNKTVQDGHEVANPYYNQLYHAWDPDRTGANQFFDHWDYTSECMLIYILAAAAPDSDHAIPAETFYAFRRELGTYNADSNPMVKSWFGPLFVYQYAQAFFNFKDASGLPLYDKEGIDWWQNSVEATKANKQFCNDNIANYAGEEDLWGLTSGYSSGFSYNVYGAPPAGVAIPSGDVRGADGTVHPSAAGGSIAMLPDECQRALKKMKELYDVYGYQIWGDYGFVNSFRMGSSLNEEPFPIASFYCAIDMGISLIMAENRDSGLIWNNFGGFELEPGKTLKDTIIQKLGFAADNVCAITVDDPDSNSNFHMGQVSAENPSQTVQFNLDSVENKAYLLTIHQFVNKALGSHTVTLGIKLNDIDGGSITFTYDSSSIDPQLIQYIAIDNAALKTGVNTLAFQWQSGTAGAKWFAWQNIEITSPSVHDTWVMARNESSTPKSFFGNKYRLDSTYYVGADINTFSQELDKDTENFSNIIFYNETTDYATITFKVLDTQNQLSNNLVIFVNNSELIFNGQVSEGDQVVTQGFYVNEGWNVITLYHPGITTTAPSGWIRWDSFGLTQAIPPVLKPPAEVIGASFGKDKTHLRWNTVYGAAKYNIYRSGAQGGPYIMAGSVDGPAVTYSDSGLSNGTPYYYVVRSVKSDNTESANSAEIKIITGTYRLDYGDGHEPNVFGGLTLDNGGLTIGDTVFVDALRYDGTAGKVRKAILQPGQKNTIALNNSNISDATMISFRVMGENGGEKFTLRLRDSGNTEAQMTFTVATGGVWQEMHVLLSDFPAAVNLSSIAAVDIVSADTLQPITLYFDEAEFDPVDLTGDKLDIAILDGASGIQATGVDFGQATASQPKVLANQYLQIDYKSSGTWGIQIYTDNKADNAYPKYSGTGAQANGLIGVSNSGYRVPMIWQVWDARKGYYNGAETPEFDTTVNDGDRAEFAFVMDKSDPDWSKDQYVRNYRTLINSNGELGAPVPLAYPPPGYWPRTTAVGNAIYVYLAADFSGAPAQEYRTSRLTVDIYHT
ncbi:MAG: FG-GAP-like repeat-containing protein [Candidatus Omnitrophota bacterium]